MVLQYVAIYIWSIQYNGEEWGRKSVASAFKALNSALVYLTILRDSELDALL